MRNFWLILLGGGNAGSGGGIGVSSHHFLKTSFRYLTTNERVRNDADLFEKDSDRKDDGSAELFDLTPNIPEAEEAQEKEEKFREYVQKSRNVSRFSKVTAEYKYRQKIPTYTDSEATYLKDPKYYRKVYAKHGIKSGIDPGILWPSKSQLENLINEEKEYDLTLEKKISILVERKLKQIESNEKLEKETDEALKKMPKQIDTYFDRVVKKELAEQEKKAKRKEIMDQAREYYGFEVDLRDPRIQEMVTKLQDEKKAADKQKKKEEEKKKAQTSVLQQKLKESEKLIQESLKLGEATTTTTTSTQTPSTSNSSTTASESVGSNETKQAKPKKEKTKKSSEQTQSTNKSTQTPKNESLPNDQQKKS